MSTPAAGPVRPTTTPSLTTVPVRPGPGGPPDSARHGSLRSSRTGDHGHARAALDVLVAQAALADIPDGAEAARMREHVDEVITWLIAAGRLPAHLRVAPDDPAVVVTRLLVVAARRLDGSREPGSSGSA